MISALGAGGISQLSEQVDALDASLAHYSFNAHEVVDRSLRSSIAEAAARLRHLKNLP
jgi:hypothetical protein